MVAVSRGIEGIITNNVRTFPGLFIVMVEEGKGDHCYAFLIA